MNENSLKSMLGLYPTGPGVYLMKNSSAKIIYVGKAKNLKSRIRSYFSNPSELTPKTQLLMSAVVDIEYILTSSEVEAFLLEASLIKKHKPKFNIRLKDDRSYPYIRLTWQDKYPRFFLARKVVFNEDKYFGPYTSGSTVEETIRFLNGLFRIRDCSDAVFRSRKRPCLTHQMGRCTAPCVGLISSDDYKKDVLGALDFLNGKNQKLIQDLTQRMKNSANEEKFEIAARLRDSLRAVQNSLQKQSVISLEAESDQDIFHFYGDSRGTCVEILILRAGQIIGNRSNIIASLNPLDPSEDPREWLVSFINQYYSENKIPQEVLIPVELGRDLIGLLENVLKERSRCDVRIRLPTDEKGKKLLEMTYSNAKTHFERHLSHIENRKKGLEEIQWKLHLPRFPARLECFDISHFQGANTVASRVVFVNGFPSKADYRRYKLNQNLGGDDYRAMQEVLRRRILRYKEDPLPDLMLIDGGKGQLNMALAVWKDLSRELNLEIALPMAGLAKARMEKKSEERFYLPGQQNPVTFSSSSQAFHILVGLRDEAHRFALHYHRNLREKSFMSE